MGGATSAQVAVRSTAVERRILALWAPDWPAAAAAAERDLAPHEPIAVLHANRVVACSASARRAGVRRGMRKRQAQANCPHLVVAADDANRDGRVFEPVVAAMVELVPNVEVLRPGLCVLPISAGVRYFGSVEVLAEALVDAVSALGVESSVGVADEMFTAVLAARRGIFVEAGGDAAYLVDRPVGDLMIESSLCDDRRVELVELLWHLGIRTVGAFAALTPTDVATRFDDDAVLAHRQARALPSRPPSGQAPAPDLAVEYTCDPPIERIDAAAFLGRRLADELHHRLSSAAVACTRLAVRAITELGQEHSRIWRCAQPLTPDATADRIRWQLEGWLTAKEKPDSPIVTIVLEPIEVVAAGALQYELTGGREVAERARRALVRVQGLLGGDSVRLPIRSGGRGVVEQVTMVALGDELRPAADPAAPWPGRVGEPAPAVTLTDTLVHLVDAEGDPVTVTPRGAFNAEPVLLRVGNRGHSVSWWAGPWPSGLDADDAVQARAQVLLDDSRALLLLFRTGQWWVEGVYE
ncbi:DNA polymerase Y family protein [Gordonia sp. TBRC 11910]|uniref:DNA polymerase Y family protein n=1 Tax=Gordonia asplenii TaxID=2725283 RepID=A0A848KXS9_9ACTN|nr:DNA polymerase Y family protein [Gordonia asplenii]NMO01011.1 DNA polymerase Y family protein [Gordonia asplenii]